MAHKDKLPLPTIKQFLGSASSKKVVGTVLGLGELNKKKAVISLKVKSTEAANIKSFDSNMKDFECVVCTSVGQVCQTGTEAEGTQYLLQEDQISLNVSLNIYTLIKCSK